MGFAFQRFASFMDAYAIARSLTLATSLLVIQPWTFALGSSREFFTVLRSRGWNPETLRTSLFFAHVFCFTSTGKWPTTCNFVIPLVVSAGAVVLLDGLHGRVPSSRIPTARILTMPLVACVAVAASWAMHPAVHCWTTDYGGFVPSRSLMEGVWQAN